MSLSPTLSSRRTTTRVSRYARRGWQWLTEPAVSIEDVEQRRQARLLSALLALHIVFTPMIALARLLSNADNSTYVVLVIGISYVMTLAAYALSRTQRFMRGAALYVVAVMLAVFVIAIVSSPSEIDRALKFLVMPALLSSLLLPMAATAWVVALSLFGVLLLPLVNAQVELPGLLVSLSFIGVLDGLMIVTAVIRRADQRQIKQQSEALAHSEEHHRTLLEATFEALLVYEENGNVLDVNHAFEVMFGCTRAEVIGRAAATFAAEESRMVVLKHWRENDLAPYEVLGRRQDGSTFEIEVVTRTHNYMGRPVHVATVRDIAERKRAEKQRFELAIERERVAVLQRFISDASHDLRTPLTNIKTSLYLVKKLATDPEKQKHHMETIEQQTVRLERLFSDLLMLSRLDKASTGEFKFGLVDLNSLLTEVLERHAEMADIKRHAVEFVRADDVPLVWADKLRLAQAVSNILVNAINFTPDCGCITVRTYSEEGQAMIEVKDNGIGIHERDLPHIFESFYRGDTARSADTGGVGLGLSIVKRIVEAHRGTIEVESTPSVGSTFRVLLKSKHG